MVTLSLCLPASNWDQHYLAHKRGWGAAASQSSFLKIRSHFRIQLLKKTTSPSKKSQTTTFRIFGSWKIWGLWSGVCGPPRASCSRTARLRPSWTWRAPPAWRWPPWCPLSGAGFATWTGSRKPFCRSLSRTVFLLNRRNFWLKNQLGLVFLVVVATNEEVSNQKISFAGLQLFFRS